MFETLYKLYHQKNTLHLFVISFIVFAVINIIENVIHYNIGKTSNAEFEFSNPTIIDWKKIIVTMIIFALLQGILTMYFY
jgi:tetrahydromethanopterin S-methyltransferase subunit D